MSSATGQLTASQAEDARKRHRDTWFYALCLGGVIILFGNILSIGPWVLAIAVSLTMVGFAWITKDTEVPADTKGDAFYYLGLLFTFVALIAALLTFDWGTSGTAGNSTAGTIRNFGIALLTTIVGLAGRVWFSMSQASPGDVAATAKSAIEEAVSAMKGSLDRARDDIDTMSNKFRESARDLGSTTNHMADTAKNAVKISDSLHRSAEESAAQAASFSHGMADFREAVRAGSTAIYDLDHALVGISDRTNRFGERFDALSQQLKGVRDTLSSINAEAASAALTLSETSRGIARAPDDAVFLGKTLAGLREEAARARGTLSDIADSVDAPELSPAFHETTSQVTKAGERIRSVAAQATQLYTELEGLSRSVGDAKGGLAAVSRAAHSSEQQVAGSGNGIFDSLEAVGKQALGLKADLGALGDQSVEFAAALHGAQQQTEKLSNDIHGARRSGFSASPSNGPIPGMLRSLRRIATGGFFSRKRRP